MALVLRKKEDLFVIALILNDTRKAENIINTSALDWKYILTVLEKNKIRARCADTLLSIPLPASISGKLKKYITAALFEAKLNKKIYMSELAKIGGVLKKNDIDFILLKGLSIDQGGLRDIGDLDLLVHEHDLKNIFPLLHGINYTYNEDTCDIELNKNEMNDVFEQLHWNIHFGFFNEKTGLLCEIHTNLFHKDRMYIENLDVLTNGISSFWNNRVYNSLLGCHTLSKEDLLILMCIHVTIKRALKKNRFALRGLLDIKTIVENDIDWDYFYERMNRLQVNYYVFFALKFTYSILNMSALLDNIGIIKKTLKKRELFLSRIHFRCFLTLRDSAVFYIKIYDFFMPFILGKQMQHKLKSLFILPLFIPTRLRMEQIFGIDRRSPLIYLAYLALPFRWLFLFINRFKHIK
ncbi:MAG: nucleotidyltransferase family protein [Spirochaetales bacterium]|nr:nucleotidyltransferase family protein [Spirochaetales bacterium]